MSKSISEWIARGSVSEEIARQRGYVELVRCKDCRHCYFRGFLLENSILELHPEINVCDLHPEIENPADNWFCADGERRRKDELEK